MIRMITLASLLCLAAQPVHAQSLADDIAGDLPGLMEIYKDFHANPELSFQETRSAKKMADAARAAGFKVTEKVGQTGIVAVMENGPGPVVMIRADMDGLPVVEQTGLPYASTKRGVSTAGVESGLMHACGHDTHMTAWIATARLLAERKDEWSGTLVMIGQPAEELGLGSRAMLEDGLYERFPKPDYVLAFHDSADMPAGVVGATPGWALANVDSVDIDIKGIGGHGAQPHTTKDPIVLGAAIVNRLQTIVSREVAPLEPAVVTVGSFHAGAKHNIISDQAKLELTVRSFSDETRKQLLDAIRRIAQGEGRVAGLAEDMLPTVTVKEPYTRSTYNTPELTNAFLADMRRTMGEEQVIQTPPTTGGEDFGEFLRADEDDTQSLIFWVGGVPAEKFAAAQRGEATLPSLHSPFWAPEADKVIASAALGLTRTALRLMPASN